MSQRLAFLVLLLMTSGCVFISEPDIGASDHFDFEPEESSAAEPHRDLDNNVGSGSSPSISDVGVACDEDSATSQEPDDGGSTADSHEALDGSLDNLSTESQDFDPTYLLDLTTDGEEGKDEEEGEDVESEESEDRDEESEDETLDSL